MAARYSTTIVVVACAVVLAASCVLWSLLVQRVGTDVCSLRPVPHRAGPVKCHRHVRSHRAAKEPGLSRVHLGRPTDSGDRG